MIDPISVTLTLVAEKFFSSLVSKVTNKAADELWSKLQNEPTKIAFKQALGKAIQNYASSGSRLPLSEPLLRVDGLLVEDRVIDELSQVVRFNRDPNYEFIGERWKLYLESPPLWRDFSYEAKLFVGYFAQELRNTSVFREIFNTKSLDALADNSESSLETLIKIENQLESLSRLLSSNFGELNRLFADSPLHAEIRDFSRLIEGKTQNFVGRNFVFDKIQDFLKSQKSGYFLVRGDPGIGKSALLAQLVKTKGYIHHFNVQAEGINKPSDFLTNVCAQLIVTHKLEYTSLPSNAGQDSGFFSLLLDRISAKLSNGDQVVITIDALDEANNQDLPTGANALFLPLTLPPGIYIVATMRRTELPLRIECAHEFFDIRQDSPTNTADIREYVHQATSRERIQKYITSQEIDSYLFVEDMILKSQGNFMYLHYVFFELEYGAYKNYALSELPAGLKNYYEDHWKRMRGKDEDAWFTYKLPVIMALTVVQQPVSINLLSDYSGITERPRIREVLREWEQFLNIDRMVFDGVVTTRYRLYHASFHDFIAAKEVISDERVSRVDAYAKIANDHWETLFNE